MATAHTRLSQTKRRTATAWLAGLGACLALATGCRHDPVPQGKIDALPDDSRNNDDRHRPGQACLLCHSSYGGATLELAIGGTVFSLDSAGNRQPAVGVAVTITDSAGPSRVLCTNSAGNFYIKKDDWTDIAYPLTAQAGSRPMASLIGRDGSCGSCHKLPDKNSVDPKTGSSRDSPGMVLVEAGGPDPQCGGAP